MKGYFSGLWDSTKRSLRKTATVGLLSVGILAGTFSDASGQQRKAVTHTFERGEYTSLIAKRSLEEEGKIPTIEEIIARTDSISSLNGKGSVEDYPWHSGYDCSEAEPEDPNCVYPGEKFVVGYETFGTESSSPDTLAYSRTAETGENDNGSSDWLNKLFWGVVGGLLAGAKLYIDYRTGKRRSKQRFLDELVNFKNDNAYSSIDNLVFEHDGREYKGDDLRDAYKQYFENYNPGDKIIERYDSDLAPEAMKRAMVEGYIFSEKNLDDLAEEISTKYGMRVSATTLSNHAREKLEVLKVKNRLDARKAIPDILGEPSIARQLQRPEYSES